MSSVTTLLGQEQGRVSDFFSKINTHVVAKKGVNETLAKAVLSQIQSKDRFIEAAEEISFDNDLSMGFDLFKDSDQVFFNENKAAILMHVAKMIGNDDKEVIAEHVYNELDFEIHNKFSEKQVFNIISSDMLGTINQFIDLNNAIAQWAVKMSILQTCKTWNTYMANNMTSLAINK